MSEQTAENSPQTAHSQAQHDLAYLQTSLQDETKRLVIEASTLNDRKDRLYKAVRALTTTLSHYVTCEYRDQARTTTNEDMGYFNEVIEGVCEAIEYVVKLSEISYVVNHLQKEVNRD